MDDELARVKAEMKRRSHSGWDAKAAAKELAEIEAELRRRGEWAEHPDMAEMHADFGRRYANQFAQVDTDYSLAEVEAELARREAEPVEPMAVVGRAIGALAAAFAELATTVGKPAPPMVKTIERDESGNIVRIIESPQ